MSDMEQPATYELPRSQDGEKEKLYHVTLYMDGTEPIELLYLKGFQVEKNRGILSAVNWMRSERTLEYPMWIRVAAIQSIMVTEAED